MQISNKSIIITLASVLVAAFFLSWFKFFYLNLSGWNLVFNETGRVFNTNFKYTAILIPIAGVLIIYGAAVQNENYLVSKAVLFKIPILALIITTLSIVFILSENSDFGSISKIFGIGFYLTLIASIILPFLKSQSTVNKISKAQIVFPAKPKVSIALAVIGIILIIISTQDQLFTKTNQFRVDPGRYGLPKAYNIMGTMYDSETYIDTKKKNFFLFTGLAALFAGVLLYGLNRPLSNSTISKNDNTTSNTISETQTLPQTINKPNYIRPQININLPKIDWKAILISLKAYILKFKIGLLVGAGIVIAALIVYNFFIKDDPVKDGKLFAKKFCSCAEELNRNNSTTMQSFLNDFENKKYKTRLEAKNDLTALLTPGLTKYSNCLQEANIKYREKYADYNAKNGENTYLFQQTYTSITDACNTNNGDFLTFQNQTDAKIKTIKDPEPDIEKIKSVLIGQVIQGWKFNSIAEFKSVQILSSSKSTDRLEYIVNLILIGPNPTDDEHECEVMIVFLQNETGWELGGVNLNYITFTNTFYPDKVSPIVPLEGCTWTAENNYKMSWQTSPEEYGNYTITGPDMGATTLPFSNMYYIKSLEGKIIKVKFTYKPKN